MKYDKGELLIAPTKKCIWRLCLLAQIELYGQARTKGSRFRKFEATESTKGWGRTIHEELSPLAGEYIKEFKEDNWPEKLTIRAPAENSYQGTINLVSTILLLPVKQC